MKLFGRLLFVKPRTALSEINEALGEEIEFEFVIGDTRPKYKAPYLMIPFRDENISFKPVTKLSASNIRPRWKAKKIEHYAIIYRGVRYIRAEIK